MSLLFGVILLNDLAKLMNHLYAYYLDYKNEQMDAEERRMVRKNEENEERNRQVQIDLERGYLLDLEQKLERFHHKLVVSVAANKK